MNSGRIILPQLMSFLPEREFSKCVHRYRGEYHIRTFSCFDQFLCMAFAQLTYRESLRDIEICLRAMQPKLYHAGIRGKVSRSTLADANEKRDWRIYADFAHVLIGMARELYVDEDFGLQITEAAYVLDSTTIDLCLSLFPWASFRQHKGAIKLHTEMDLRGSIPCVIRITHGKIHDVTFLDQLLLEPAAFTGISENAVKTQIWIAISVYVLVAIIKKKLRIERTLNEILQVLSITLFENDELLPLLTNFHLQDQKEVSYNQLTLFNF